SHLRSQAPRATPSSPQTYELTPPVAKGRKDRWSDYLLLLLPRNRVPRGATDQSPDTGQVPDGGQLLPPPKLRLLQLPALPSALGQHPGRPSGARIPRRAGSLKLSP